LVRNPNSDVLVKSWDVEEKVTIGYLKANIDAAVGSVPVTGNFGFQMVHTDQSSTALGASGTGDGRHPRQPGGRQELCRLPAQREPAVPPAGNEQSLRFAVARTLARPRMDQMRAARPSATIRPRRPTTDINTSPWSGSGGNPELEPWRANSIDVSYEKYFGRQAYVSLAAFYKDLKTYVYDQSVVFDFTGFPTTAAASRPRARAWSPRRRTVKGGSMKGVEFAASIPGSLLFIRLLDGFGASSAPRRPRARSSRTPADLRPRRSRACRRRSPT
jgi:iron complex outermembrane receptor protein